MKKSTWFCTECGYENLGYIGKCPVCSAWNCFKEAKFDKKTSEKRQNKNSRKQLFVSPETEALNLQEIRSDEITRMNSGSEEFNRVLGGGIVPGSLVLVGGEPGIGKSTILLQTADHFARAALKVLYVSAEESSRQLKLRASRLDINSPISVLAENSLERIIEVIEEEEPNLVIVDSIQATQIADIDSFPGSPSQIRECTGNLMRLAKNLNIPVIIVGHINKEGDIAGPKILEHMVDTVLQFEGSKDSQIRFLRTIKNRFGSTDEIGIFQMEGDGLKDLTNPSELFLQERSGGVIFPSHEGRRTLLLEVQALINESDYHNPRRLANGINTNRLHQILAILEKKLSLALARADAYINVAGGLSIRETSADLAVALALYTSAMKIDLAGKDIIAIGELGLNGEIRSVSDCRARIQEALKLGFKTILVPEINLSKLQEAGLLKSNTGVQIIAVKNINAAIEQVNNLCGDSRLIRTR